MAWALQPCRDVRIFLYLLLVSTTACSAQDVLLGKDCTSTQDQSFDLQNPDTPTAFKIESCRVDADACRALCSYVLSQKQIASEASACDVSFDGAVTHVTASYEVFNGGPNCPVFDNIGGAP